MAPEMDADPALASCIRRKRPDGWAVHWGRRRVRILEFRPYWREETEAYKTARYQPLRDRMLASLPNGWSVEIINFILGIWCSFAETQWTAALLALGVPATRVTHLMTDLVAQCLTELNELYSTRAAALRQRADAQV
jgi:hypothetical protein